MLNKIQQIASKIPLLKTKNIMEEPTKMALIAPFLQSLGYDVFDTDEVFPEYTTDFGTKKGEKVDYVILSNKEPIILIECKPLNSELSIHGSQLFRYFTVSKAKFGILTNGEIYNFYTDLAKPNIMDDTPFLCINISNITKSDVEQLNKFHKSNFNSDKIFSDANDLKYISQIKNIIKFELEKPSEDFIKFFTTKIYTGRNTEKILSYFSNLIKLSFNGLLLEDFNNKINLALNKNEVISEVITEEEKKNIIETTELEIESFYLIKSILRNQIPDIDRIKYKDTVNYFNIFLDNTRNTICRLYLNGNKKYIVFLDENKKETNKTEINTVSDLYKLENDIIEKTKILWEGLK